jgi:hypothetical protein
MQRKTHLPNTQKTARLVNIMLSSTSEPSHALMSLFNPSDTDLVFDS